MKGEKRGRHREERDRNREDREGMEWGKGVNTNVCDTVCVQVQNIDN